MRFDPTRPSSERNRARPLTAAEAFVQAEAKSRIMMSRNARRAGFGFAIFGVVGALWRSRYQIADLSVRFPGGRTILLSVGQFVCILVIPLGLVIGTVGYFLHRRYMRDAMTDPLTAAIFDPSVEWPEDR